MHYAFCLQITYTYTLKSTGLLWLSKVSWLCLLSYDMINTQVVRVNKESILLCICAVKVNIPLCNFAIGLTAVQTKIIKLSLMSVYEYDFQRSDQKGMIHNS